jgi:ribosomal protein L37E
MPDEPRCRRCGQELLPEWRLCPRCGLPRDERDIPWAESVTRTAQRDVTMSKISLIFVGCFVVVGFALFSYVGGLTHSTEAALVIAILGGSAIATVIGAVMLLRTQDPSAASAKVARGVLSGCAVASTVAVVMLVLVLAAIAALAIAVLQACGSGCK